MGLIIGLLTISGMYLLALKVKKLTENINNYEEIDIDEKQ